MTIQDLIIRLNRVEPKPGEPGHYRASCPCKRHTHGDRSKGLEFFQDVNTGKIVIHCHAGCETEEICDAIGVSMSDLMPEPTEQDRQRSFLQWYAERNGLTFEAVYSYCYGMFQDGLAKAKFRKADGKKDFRWIKTDSSTRSGFSMTHKGCPQRLYMRGNPDSEKIFLVEGEKDADTLYRWTKETTASTENGATKKNAGKKWFTEYEQQLNGKDVYILGDNDEDGRNFAEIEAASIKGHAAHVYMLDILKMWPDCPEKGDISDMVEALGTDETFSRLAKLIRETEPEPDDSAELLDYDDVIGDPGDKEPAEDPSLSMENQSGTPEIHDEPKQKPNEPQPTTTDPAPARKPANSILSIERFMAKAQTEAFRPIPTGIREFDDLINGGFLRQTLVTLGASPGAGKTVIAQQIFEAAAENGNADVLYFNLEMSEEQLIARSLSRRSSSSQTDVMRGYEWTEQQRRAVNTAAQYYAAKIAPHIAYNPADKPENKSSAYYQDIIQSMELEATLRDPVKPLICVIDYLQLLQSRPDEKGRILDDVETIKAALKAFKDFAIKYNTVVFLIMAHSRATNTDGNATQGAGRDTSAIEYSGDLQLSLNYGAIVDGTFKNLATMEQKIADPELPQYSEELYDYRCLVVTKNRFGRDRKKCYMTFIGEQSRFDFTTRCRTYKPPKPPRTPSPTRPTKSTKPRLTLV